MQVQQAVSVQCPFCFESISVMLDAASGSEQSFIYDCEVCCRPIELEVRQRGGEFEVQSTRAYD